MASFKILALLTFVGLAAADYGQSGCGDYGVLTLSSGFIKSHSGFGTMNYGHDKDCSWNIVAPAGYRIRFQFIGSIDIEDHDNCNYDYVQLFDGSDWNEELIGLWCGGGEIPVALSSGNQLYLEFSTDSTSAANGFRAKYEFFKTDESGCYDVEHTCSVSRCVPASWRCDGESDCSNGSDELNCGIQQSQCKSNEFECTNPYCIPDSWECDGEDDCGDNSDERNCNIVCDADTQFTCSNKKCITSGWRCDNEDDCGDNSDEQNCENYNHCKSNEFQCANQRCVPAAYVCDTDDDCGDLSDELNCTATTAAPPTTRRPTTPATGQTSDSGCGNPANLTGLSGTFSTSNYPQFYDENSDCKWRIEVIPGQKVELEFVDFSLESGTTEAGSRSCKHDYVSIYNNRASIHELIGRYCGLTKPAPIVSQGNVMIVQFNSDSSLNKKGFMAKWKAVAAATPNQTVDAATSGCGSPRELTGDKGVILSHVSGDNYQQSMCVWTLAPAAGVPATLTFNSFELKDSDQCQSDSLKVYKGTSEQSTLAGTYCGTKMLEPIVSTTGFYIVFRAGDSNQSKGFNITYELKKSTLTATTPSTAGVSDSGCGSPSLISGPTTIRSKNYGSGNSYPTYLKCAWQVTAPQGKLIRVSFSDFHIEYHATCEYDDLSFYQGTSSSGGLIKRLCGDSLPRDIESTTRQLFIQFITDEDTGHNGFEATISFFNEPTTCMPGQFTCNNGKCITEKSACNNQNDCGDNSDEAGCFAGIDSCGQPSSKYPTKPGNTRVVGGTSANPHSWPWQVMINYQSSFICGGSLVHPSWIVTAAHCFEDASLNPINWSIYVGKHKEAWESKQMKISISKLIEYPHYDIVTTDSDLALMKLSKPVTFSDEVKPICLPGNSHLPENNICYVTGWGDTKGTGYSSELKQASVPLITRAACNKPNWYDGDVTPNMFCAGYPSGGHDGCSGDSGGPLACEVNGKFILEGITSWGIDCGLPNTPGVYTRVPNFVQWIKETIEKN